MKIFSIIILFGAFSGMLNAINITRDGKFTATIVVDQSELNAKYSTPWQYPIFQLVYADFIRHLELASGAEYNPQDTPSEQILLGRAALTDDEFKTKAASLPHGAYIIQNDGKTLRIFGSDVTGTINGIYGFLRDDLGIDFLGVNDLFTVIPEAHDIILKKFDRKVIPDFHTRNFRGFYYPGTAGYLWGLRMGTFSLQDRHALRANHAFYRLFPGVQYAKDHPEYYAMINDVRQVPKGSDANYWQLCFSNPDVIRIVTEKAAAAFASGAICFSVVPNDSMLYCQCPQCRIKQPSRPEGTHCYTDMYMDWVNRIAAALEKNYPGQYLGILAYGGTRVPPLKKIASNIFIGFTPDHSQYYDDEYEKQELSVIKAWHEKTAGRNPFGWHAYTGLCTVAPRYYAHSFGDTIKRFHKDFNFVSFSGDGFGFWPWSGPQNYLIARLLWNTSLDIDVILDGYFDRLYGPAALEMKKMFELLEKRYMAPRSGGEWLKDHNTLAALDIYSSEDVALIRKCLTNAARQGTDGKIKQRIEYIAQKCEPALLMLDIYNISRENTVNPIDIGQLEKCIRAPSEVEELWKQRILNDQTLGEFAFQSYRPDFDYTARVRKLWRLKVEENIATAMLKLRSENPKEFARLRPLFETDSLKAARIKLGTKEASVRQNVLFNPGFEETGDNAPAGIDWKASGAQHWSFNSNNPMSYCGVTPAYAHDEKNSGFIAGGKGVLLATVPLDTADGNRIFRLDGYVRQESMAGKPQLILAWSNASGRMWGAGTVESDIGTNINEWENLCILTEVPPEATGAIVMLSAQNNDGGRTWFDDIAFRKVVFKVAKR